MSLEIKIEIDDALIKTALSKAPSVLIKHVSDGLFQGALEISREAGRNVRKATSNLWTSIEVVEDNPFQFRVGSGVNYARMVEEGTGPGGFPPIQSLIDWIKVAKIEPDDPGMNDEDLAYVMARSIFRRGTPKQPFLEPALKSKQSRVRDLVYRGASRALSELGA